MNKKINLIFGIIILVILISGCVQEIAEEEPEELQEEQPKFEELQEERPQIEEEPKFNITIFFKDAVYNMTVEVSVLNLPIDSEQEACDLFKEIHTNRYTCNFTEEPDYWSFNNRLICNSASMFACAGRMIGKINKINGNIENLSGYIATS
ncbi:hypothetical protein KY343_02285 [Candidatus Woesearchaeota archaeon]|nr:hypothetical protein [Candidatus Woesearchaeota archaeon]